MLKPYVELYQVHLLLLLYFFNYITIISSLLIPSISLQGTLQGPRNIIVGHIFEVSVTCVVINIDIVVRAVLITKKILKLITSNIDISKK